MKGKWDRIPAYVLIALVPVMALGRPFEIPDPKKLFAGVGGCEQEKTDPDPLTLVGEGPSLFIARA
jgi:hypothetical protein